MCAGEQLKGQSHPDSLRDIFPRKQAVSKPRIEALPLSLSKLVINSASHSFPHRLHRVTETVPCYQYSWAHFCEATAFLEITLFQSAVEFLVCFTMLKCTSLSDIETYGK